MSDPSTTASAALSAQPVPPAVVEVREGTKLHDRYIVTQNLGVGGFAVVWKATDERLGREVAIKRLLRLGGNDLATIIEEARKTVKLDHQNIIDIYDVFVQGDEGFLVMEYVEGNSLDEVLRRQVVSRAWLDTEEALDYFRQILRGLAHAHSRGIYHRDIKPKNVLVSRLGEVKLVDFGLARPIAPVPEIHEQGVPWTGTPAFMSPEQARGEDLDHRTDIFSSGIIGYILFTGAHPFNHPSALPTIVDLIKEPSYEAPDPRTIAPNLPEQITDVLLHMLRKNKGERYDSISAALGDLDRGQTLPCPSCESPNPPNNKFCGQCGSSLMPTAQPKETTQVASDAELLTDEGFDLARQNDWLGAIAKYQEAIKLDPFYGRAYSNLGYSLNRLGKFDEAQGVLSAGEGKTTDRDILSRILDARGFAKSNLRDHGGAIADFTRAIEFNASNPRIYYHRARTFVSLKRFNEAYSDVLLALKLNPEYPHALKLKTRLENQGYVTPLATPYRATFVRR